MQELRLSFGGGVFSFIAESECPPLEINPRYHPFISNAKPDFSFLVEHKVEVEVELGEPIFDTGGDCTFHLVDGHLVIHTRNPIMGLQQIVRFEDDYQGGTITCIGDRWCEAGRAPLGYPIEELIVVWQLAQQRGVLLHASAVKDQQHGILFNGISGAGKSTMASLWDGQAGVTVLSDDRVIVREQDGQFWAYGTPWQGSARISSPDVVPLERIFVLHHAEKNEVVPLDPADAVTHMIPRSFPPFWDAAGMAFTLEFLERLARAVPCYSLGFTPNENIIDFVRCVS